MAGNPKFAILEKGGEEFGGPVEYVPEANDILFEYGQDERLDEVIYTMKNTVRAGWQEIVADQVVIVEARTVATATKFTKELGFIKHLGFIKGTM